VLDSILANKSVCVQDDWDEHVSGELVDFKEVQQNHEELVQRVLNLGEGVGGKVLTVILLYPRYAQLKQDLAGERGVRVELEGFHS